MRLHVLRTTTIVGLLFCLSSSLLLAEGVQKIVHEFEIGKGTRAFISELIRRPEAQKFLRDLIKESFKEGRDTIKEVRMTIQEIVQLIKEGGPIADKIIEKIGTEERKDKAAKAKNKLKLEEIRLKIEQEKQQTIRKQAQLNQQIAHNRHETIVRSLKVCAWPATATILGCVGIKIAVSLLSKKES